ncbi:Glutamate 5-kinase [Tepidanaerobacter acetatoxydans Re1]|uniref:Glutamate 5-kinase n=1 Tax=Tepidanaerobacter acetatoxydans (strain DSM 21804 / JCM 16047 / Re1) TaxID=1209989 RepID=F4LRA9_TEPAE|nr:Glutamate 5-kinase [Tepidanaerobacter acetatoxydans Re1]CCP27118.2 Glutamate 5-kinase [Tepidanaerobacter acetatoxydans Re1]
MKTLKADIYKTIVVKVGTTTLVHENGKLNIAGMERLVRVISNIKNSGKNVVLVTSGAVGTGAGRLGIKGKSDIRIKQALAAVGQGILMQFYEKLFLEYGINVAQILLTKDDLENGVRRQNAFNTLTTLFEFDVVPIVNENDTIAVEEIVYGDNDTLAAVVATLIDADLLVLLSDVDGLYTLPPHEPGAEKIPYVKEITPEIEAIAEGTYSNLGTGGMQSKVKAAKIATEAGIAMAIIGGENPTDIYNILEGTNCGTFFEPKSKACTSKKNVI